ncbi:MAG: formate dehydrogenase accessory sulfurtransferase FdhD [Anaerolineae bacterium]|nr:formate dehydrogenase accessory sulfurtransferase FdhD [Anaerolineae bacterium]
MTSKKGDLTSYAMFEGNAFHSINHKVVEEIRACIFLNGQELATLMCSPHQLDELAIGFLRSEELITSIEDIASLTLSAQGTCIDVWLKNKLKEPPAHRITTSGCGGGVTFDDLLKERMPLPPLTSITTAQVGLQVKKLFQAAILYKESRGIHASALSDGNELLLVAEDIGRHNTIDRLWGQALKRGIDTENRILICTGRISSEMLGEAVKAKTPIIISCTSPTSLSIAMACAWNITVVGYARGGSFRIYSAPSRIILSEQIQQD